jgi:hypothetical protein
LMADQDIGASPLLRFYTPKEIAERWKVSDETVRRIFLREPGVVQIRRRTNILLRVPENVLLRLERRMAVPEDKR